MNSNHLRPRALYLPAKVVGIPFRLLPTYLNFTVGIIALPRESAVRAGNR